MKEPKESTIGGVARGAGVNVETVRYYQRTGLVPVPKRVLGTFREYPPETVTRIRFIKRAQQLGFSLAEVKNLLALDEGQNCMEAQGLAVTKLATIETRISDLRRMRGTLKDLIDRCAAGGGRVRCPIIETLTQGNS